MSPSERPLAWVRPPQQARSRATLTRILDAAEALLAEKSWEDSPVQEIARRADSSVGAFYTRFHDKHGLLRALQERFLEEALTTADAALDPERWEGASVAEIVTEVVAFLVQIHRERGALLRALQLRAATDHDFRARFVHLTRRIAAGLRSLVLARRAELTHPQPALAAEFSLRIMLAVLLQRLLLGDEVLGTRVLSERQLSAELTRACLAHLGVACP